MKSEEALAATVVRHLRDLHWDVHQEVVCGGPRADIVAVQGARVWVIESKMSLTLDLLGQALEWRGVAHYVSVAVPKYAKAGAYRARAVSERILREWGIGLMRVTATEPGDRWAEARVDTELAPRLDRHPHPNSLKNLRARLCDDTRTFAAAGNAQGKFWSPFKATVREIHRALGEKDGLSTRELVASISHHYSSDSSARSTLPKWLMDGKIPGVRGEHSGKVTLWHLVREAKSA